MSKLWGFARSFSSTSLKYSKEIKATKVKNKIIVEGVPIKEKEKNDFFKFSSLRSLNQLRVQINYTDVLILRQFLNKDGSILPINATKLKHKDQLTIEMLVERSKRAGLLPVKITEEGEHIYYDGGPHKFNVYYNKNIVGLPKRNKLFPPVRLKD